MLREQAYHVYALRFEALAEPARAQLRALGGLSPPGGVGYAVRRKPGGLAHAG